MNRARWIVLALVVVVLAVLIAPVKVVGRAPTGASVGMVMVVPVVIVALRAGRIQAFLAALGAGLLMSLLLPPVGTFTIRFGDDVVALAVFVGVAVAVGSLVRTRVELLERLEQQRELLLRAVSHDLRTPLAGVRAAASELTSDAHHDDAEKRELLAVIEHDVERLDRLVGNLLSLGRSQAGAFAPTKEPADVAEVIVAASATIARLADHVTIAVHVAPDLPEIQCDVGQLDQLVTNLLENAVRHSRDGSVLISAAAAEGTLTITVEDDGPGVPEGDRADVFEAYRSGSNAGTSGLGLAICDAIARGHDGFIAVGRSRLGGAAFTVTLPVA